MPNSAGDNSAPIEQEAGGGLVSEVALVAEVLGVVGAAQKLLKGKKNVTLEEFIATLPAAAAASGASVISGISSLRSQYSTTLGSTISEQPKTRTLRSPRKARRAPEQVLVIAAKASAFVTDVSTLLGLWGLPQAVGALNAEKAAEEIDRLSQESSKSMSFALRGIEGHVNTARKALREGVTARRSAD